MGSEWTRQDSKSSLAKVHSLVASIAAGVSPRKDLCTQNQRPVRVGLAENSAATCRQQRVAMILSQRHSVAHPLGCTCAHAAQLSRAIIA